MPASRYSYSAIRSTAGGPTLKPLLNRIDLARAADVALLQAHWKRLRKEVRAPRIARFYLASDPLDFLAFDWQLESNLQDLPRLLIGKAMSDAPTSKCVRGSLRSWRPRL